MSYRILLLIDSAVGKLLRIVRKHWLAILLISPVCLCVSSIGYKYVYGQIGRITDFRRFSGELRLLDTNYLMDVSRGIDNYVIILKNTINKNEFKITHGIIGANPEFSTFASEGKTYFILKTEGIFEEGAMYFQIYNLSGDNIAQVVSSSTSEPTLFRSCIYPRLYDNELFFEEAIDCEIYPVLIDNQFFYSVKLQSP